MGLFLTLLLAALVLFAPEARAQGIPATCDLTEADIPSGAGSTFTIPAGQTLCAQTSVDRTVSLTVAGTLRVEPGILLNINGSFANQGLIVFEADSGGVTSAIGLNGSMSCAGGSIEAQGAPVGETLDFPLFSQFFPGTPFPEFSNGYQPFVPNSSGFVGLTFASACQAVGVSSTPDPLASLPAFTCSGDFYQVHGSPSSSVSLVDLAAGSFDTIGSTGESIRATGLDPDSLFAYGIQSQGGGLAGNVLFAIGSNGTAVDLGTVSGLTARNHPSGDFGPGGLLYVRNNGRNRPLIGIDVDTRTVVSQHTPTGLTNNPNTADFAFSPVDQSFYSVESNSGNARLLRFTLNANSTFTVASVGTTGIVTSGNGGNNVFGAMYADSDGNVYGIQNASGRLYQFSTVDGTSILVGRGAIGSQNDGFSCSQAPSAIPRDFGDAQTDGTVVDGITTNYGSASQARDPGNLFLGVEAPTAEQSNVNASDNADGDANDEAALADAVQGDTSYAASVAVFNNTGSDAFVCGFIDAGAGDGFDGTFDTGAERVCATVPSANASQSVDLNWTGLSFGSNPTTFVRLRLATVRSEAEAPTGDGISIGEVEDYAVTIVQGAPAFVAQCTASGAGDPFADEVTLYSPASGVAAARSDPGQVLGAPDFAGLGQNPERFTSLGLAGGEIVVAFRDNILSNSGDVGPELSISEIGAVERFDLFVFPYPETELILQEAGITAETDGSYLIASNVSTASIDIDPVFGNLFAQGRLQFAGVRIVSLGTTGDGPDIDALRADVSQDCSEIRNPSDYSDAPIADYGEASHEVGDPSIFLGTAAPDAEPSARQAGNGGATADGDDDDGVAIFAPLSAGDTTYSVDVNVTNMSGAPATLHGWIDFDGNLVFEADEYANVAVPDGTGAGTATLDWTGLAGTVAGDSFIRLRLTTDSLTDADAVGPALDGEVEDYAVVVASAAVSSLPPFTCSADFYEVVGGDLHVLNVSTGVYDPIGPDHQELNGAGYNVNDDYIYLVDHDQDSATRFHLYRMGSNGQIEDLGNVGVSANAGDMGPDDKLYLKDGNNSLNVVDVLTSTVTALNFTGTTGGTVLDLSYINNGTSEALVGASNGSIRFYNLTTGVAGSIPVTGLPTSTTRYGATWSTSNGNLFISENGSGTITEIADPLGSPTIIGTFAAADTSNHDGANCYNGSSPLGLPSDRSDAPITGTAPDGVGAIAYGDAEHSVGSGLRLGAVVDSDIGAIASPDATGDGADDDGVASFPTLTEGDTGYTLAVSDFNVGAGDGTLYAWIDFDGDGAFETSEFASATYTGGAVQSALSFSGFGATMSAGTTFARFRLTSDTLTSADYEAMVMDGEVEDYAVTVVAAAPIIPSCSVAQAVTESVVPTRTLNSSCSANVGVTSDGVTGNPGYCPRLPLPAGYEIAYDYVLPADNQMYALTVWANAGGAFNDDELRSFDLEVDYTPVGGGTATLVMNNVNLGATSNINDPKSVPFTVGGQPVSLPNVSQVRISNLGGSGSTLPFRELQGACGQELSDAPATYASASHEFTPTIVLGASATPDAMTVNDDSDVDDGVAIPTLRQDGTATITASVVGAGGFLQAWIDFDGSGTFEAGEQIAIDLQDNGNGGDVAANDGMITFDVAVPFDAVTLETFARFRWSTTSGLDASAAARDGEVEDYAVTIEPGAILVSGAVFLDNGTGTGGIAHDGLIQGAEPGQSDVTVQAVDAASGDVIASVQTAADGTYTLTLPPEQAGLPILVRITTPTGFRLIANRSDAPPAEVDPAGGEFRFTPMVGVEQTGLNFGLASEPRLTLDQEQAISAGSTSMFLHRFSAGAPVSVTFAIANQESPTLENFTTTLFRDDDCSGTLDAGEAVLTDPLSLAADQDVCLLVRVANATGSLQGETLRFELTATGTYANTAVPFSLTNIDQVTITDQAALLLTKTVCNASVNACDAASGSGFDRSNAGAPGDTLIYRLQFENRGAGVIDDVTVNDDTPAFSSLTASAPSVITNPAGLTCGLTAPAAPVSNYEGGLEWTCPGQMLAGAQGVVTFEVRIAD